MCYNKNRNIRLLISEEDYEIESQRHAELFLGVDGRTKQKFNNPYKKGAKL
jgi:hypothetical protein